MNTPIHYITKHFVLGLKKYLDAKITDIQQSGSGWKAELHCAISNQDYEITITPKGKRTDIHQALHDLYDHIEYGQGHHSIREDEELDKVLTTVHNLTRDRLDKRIDIDYECANCENVVVNDGGPYAVDDEPWCQDCFEGACGRAEARAEAEEEDRQLGIE